MPFHVSGLISAGPYPSDGDRWGFVRPSPPAFIVRPPPPPPPPLTTTSSQVCSQDSKRPMLLDVVCLAVIKEMKDLNLWVESCAHSGTAMETDHKLPNLGRLGLFFLSDDVRCKNIEAALQAGERGEGQSSRWNPVADAPV
nr:putative protein [Neurospora crassa]